MPPNIKTEIAKSITITSIIKLRIILFFPLILSAKYVIAICSFIPNTRAAAKSASQVNEYVKSSSETVLGELNTYLTTIWYVPTTVINANMKTQTVSSTLFIIFFKLLITVDPL